jgi:hypothetical protein
MPGANALFPLVYAARQVRPAFSRRGAESDQRELLLRTVRPGIRKPGTVAVSRDRVRVDDVEPTVAKNGTPGRHDLCVKDRRRRRRSEPDRRRRGGYRGRTQRARSATRGRPVIAGGRSSRRGGCRSGWRHPQRGGQRARMCRHWVSYSNDLGPRCRSRARQPWRRAGHRPAHHASSPGPWRCLVRRSPVHPHRDRGHLEGRPSTRRDPAVGGLPNPRTPGTSPYAHPSLPLRLTRCRRGPIVGARPAFGSVHGAGRSATGCQAGAPALLPVPQRLEQLREHGRILAQFLAHIEPQRARKKRRHALTKLCAATDIEIYGPVAQVDRAAAS